MVREAMGDNTYYDTCEEVEELIKFYCLKRTVFAMVLQNSNRRDNHVTKTQRKYKMIKKLLV